MKARLWFEPRTPFLFRSTTQMFSDNRSDQQILFEVFQLIIKLVKSFQNRDFYICLSTNVNCLSTTTAALYGWARAGEGPTARKQLLTAGLTYLSFFLGTGWGIDRQLGCSPLDGYENRIITCTSCVYYFEL